ncbi:penicillin-binding protein 2 [Candidatus Peregrinibacteria bacterium]|jgi:cell division protein FtsI/penicillin-binding protein 2|nr:penicillin-binding protein 2 [Candidatus Peregrinibacteria bacterium]MBT5468136.1 penicillin-binding protein 2 [Candidatus Peregrinibacteria bacterium]MBT7337946.1 penicillin-binding protein 2 [Candidatus Peregrinibacteria bacterium]
MALASHTLSETQRKRLARHRIVIVHAALLLALLVVVARLLELQIIKGKDYRTQAQSQHFGGVVLPAKRGIIYSHNSKTGEQSILATNTTLELAYVDPMVTDKPTYIASELAHLLVTEDFHELCGAGDKECPTELAEFYANSFDPLERIGKLQSGALLEPLTQGLPDVSPEDIPDIEDIRRSFARDIEKRISEKRVTFVPLVYGATKIQMKAVRELALNGVYVVDETRIIFADPEEISSTKIASMARTLEPFVDIDDTVIRRLLRSRPLRYVPIMRRLPPDLSLKVRELKLTSFQETNVERSKAATREAALSIQDPMRSVALLPEHWRYYPDGKVASHVVGFLNSQQEAQYGIERTFNLELRGQEGRITSMSDPQGGQILSANQTIVDAKDGDNITLTIDRFVQKKVEEIMDDAVKRFEADAGQAIIMDPFTGRIIAMVNAPTFDSNNFGTVYGKEPWYLDKHKQDEVVAELYHPKTNQFVVKMYLKDLYSEEGRLELSEKTYETLQEIETMYDLKDIIRYYLYIGENSRREIFPTERPDFWLRFTNNIGVGAYLNRNIQEIYEPGSVFKPITMAIAIDQGEVSPDDLYEDTGTVEVDEYKIKNALNAHYGEVNMINCLEFSVNTCMTSVSMKLGKKLFHRMIERFGFGKITTIELEDELPGEILPWKKWSQALLATAAYGQGISATPLQVITGWSALANGGKLIRPTIIDSVEKSDGTVIETKTFVVDQVITEETSETISAMLVSVVENGFGRSAGVPGYKIAGKTGTSQMAGPGGQYEIGTGSSITSFAGFAPANHAKFVMLIKFDRPRAKDIEFGSQSAAPVFGDIAKFLFSYYGIPPTEE